MTDAGEGLEARLENWGAAIRGRRLGGSGMAESFEGRYRSPQQWHALGAPAAIVADDQDDAQVIESAVVLTPLYHHALLRGWYVLRWSEGKCLSKAREIGGPDSPTGRFFPRQLEEAQAFVAWALELPAAIRKHRAREYVQRKLGGVDELAALDNP